MKRHVELGGRKGPVPGGLCPLVTINVQRRGGAYAKVLFCIDTGADQSSLPTWLAEANGIPFSRDEHSRRTAAGLVGSVMAYQDFINVRLFNEEFRWPCAFLVTQGPASRIEYGVIGRLGFLASFNACVKRPHCTIERRTDHLPLWRRVLTWFSRSRLHPFDLPL
jgi:hypothetical protein